MNRTPRWLALIVAIIGVVCNLPALLFGFSLLWDWIRLDFSSIQYFHYAYLQDSVFWLLVSALGMTAAGVTIRKSNTYDIVPILSVIFGLACTVALRNVSPRLDLSEEATKLLGHADHSLSDWDESHGRFPANEQELREALVPRPLHELPIFFQDGKPIPYEVRVVTSATAPALEPLPPAPGVVIYAVSSDQKEYWLTMTTLRNPVGGPVAVLRIGGESSQGEIFVMQRKHHNPGEGREPFIE